MNDEQKLTLWVGATRYYLGRTTYAVSSFCDLLRQEWLNLPDHTLGIIIRDIEEAFAQDDRARESGANFKPLGHDCDRQSWETVRALWIGNDVLI